MIKMIYFPSFLLVVKRRLKWDTDVIPISLSPNASTSPSPNRFPINRNMMKKIHMGLSQDGQVNHGLFTLFTWAK